MSRIMPVLHSALPDDLTLLNDGLYCEDCEAFHFDVLLANKLTINVSVHGETKTFKRLQFLLAAENNPFRYRFNCLLSREDINRGLDMGLKLFATMPSVHTVH